MSKLHKGEWVTPIKGRLGWKAEVIAEVPHGQVLEVEVVRHDDEHGQAIKLLGGNIFFKPDFFRPLTAEEHEEAYQQRLKSDAAQRIKAEGAAPESALPLVMVEADNWFIGPDGKKYSAVYGPLRLLSAEQTLGFTPKGNGSTNWYVEVGRPGRCVRIAGCKVHFMTECAACPLHGDVLDLSGGEGA